MASSTESGLSVFTSVCPLCPACPPGFRPLFSRRGLVRRRISSFIFSLEGGVLLLLEFLPGASHLPRRFSNSFIHAFFLQIVTFKPSMFWLRTRISSRCASMILRSFSSSSVRLLSTSAMSVTTCFIGVKVQKNSNLRKRNTKLFYTFFVG